MYTVCVMDFEKKWQTWRSQPRVSKRCRASWWQSLRSTSWNLGPLSSKDTGHRSHGWRRVTWESAMSARCPTATLQAERYFWQKKKSIFRDDLTWLNKLAAESTAPAPFPSTHQRQGRSSFRRYRDWPFECLWPLEWCKGSIFHNFSLLQFGKIRRSLILQESQPQSRLRAITPALGGIVLEVECSHWQWLGQWVSVLKINKVFQQTFHSALYFQNTRDTREEKGAWAMQLLVNWWWL